MYFGVEVEAFLARCPPFLNDSGAHAPILADLKKHMTRIPANLRNALTPDEAAELESPSKQVEYFKYKDAKRDTAFNIWKVTTDASIRGDMGESVGGLEFITPKLPFSRVGLELLRHYVTGVAIGGFVTNDSTALHVHVSCQQLSDAQMRRFCAFAVSLEHVTDMFVNPKRREDCSKYIRSNLCSVSTNRNWLEAAAILEGIDVATPEGIDLLVNVMCVKLAPVVNSERNHKLNLVHLRGTSLGCPTRRVEFRQHQGTTDPHEACDWTTLCVKYLNAAARVPVSPMQLAEQNDWLESGIPESFFWTLIDDPVLEQRFVWYKQAAAAQTREFAFEGRELYVTREDAYEDQNLRESATL